MTDLSVNIAGVKLKNPIVTASGTFGFGNEYGRFYDISQLGAISVKGLTLKPRAGNPPPRIAETPMGIINSVGLQNPGVERFLSVELPYIKKKDTVVICNIAGNTEDEYIEMAKILSDSLVDLLEVNISCPNVAHGGMAFGKSPGIVNKLTAAVKKNTKKPVIIKLSPNVSEISEMAAAAEAGGGGLPVAHQHGSGHADR